MLDGLQALNERMYELCGRLYENEELLSKKQSDYMSDKLFEAYKRAYEVLEMNAEPATASEAFAAKERRKQLVPYVPGRLARFFLRRRANAAARLLLREVREAAERDFAARAARLDMLAENDVYCCDMPPQCGETDESAQDPAQRETPPQAAWEQPAEAGTEYAEPNGAAEPEYAAV